MSNNEVLLSPVHGNPLAMTQSIGVTGNEDASSMGILNAQHPQAQYPIAYNGSGDNRRMMPLPSGIRVETSNLWNEDPSSIPQIDNDGRSLHQELVLQTAANAGPP